MMIIAIMVIFASYGKVCPKENKCNESFSTAV
jgi:hypothetical protein